MLECFDV